MTVGGAERVGEELEERKRVQRPRIVQAIAEARDHGDLKENAEYHAAREQQSFCGGRIQEIESKVSNAPVRDVTTSEHTGKVYDGSTVTIINLETDQEMRYQIVGDDEADVKAHKISVNSPIARALVGKEEGDVVVVQTPGGEDRKSTRLNSSHVAISY